jgi:uncharacterized RDD family membrane protein YckC
LPQTAQPAAADVATLRTRIGGYVVDMVILSAVTMVVVVIAGIVLLVATDGATQSDVDNELYAFLAIIGFGVPLAWTALNLFLLMTRSQTGGQYVAGIRLINEDGRRLSPRAALAWWFALNPLLFNWPLAAVVGMPIAAVVALSLSRFTLLAFALLVSLCLVAPIVALLAALVDRQNRGLHDRVAGVVAVPA